MLSSRLGASVQPVADAAAAAAADAATAPPAASVLLAARLDLQRDLDGGCWLVDGSGLRF